MPEFSIKVTKKMNISKNTQGHLFALTANIMWGLMSPIGKSALQEFSALSVTTFRMVGAAAAFWILSVFCRQEHVPPKDMLKIFFASLFALVFNQGVFIFGLSLTSPIDASIVTTTLPIITMIVAAIPERAYNKQESTGYLCRGNGGIDINTEQSDFCKWGEQYLGRSAMLAGTAQFLHLSDRIQGIDTTIFCRDNQQMDVHIRLDVLYSIFL